MRTQATASSYGKLCFGHSWNAAAAAAAGIWTGQTSPSARESKTSALNLTLVVVKLEGWRVLSHLGPELGKNSPRVLPGGRGWQAGDETRVPIAWPPATAPDSDPATSLARAAVGLGLLGRSVCPHKQGISGERAMKVIFSSFQSLPGTSHLAEAWGSRKPPAFV